MLADERFWQSSVEELTKGFTYDSHEEAYICLICNERFQDGVVYKREERLYEARKAIHLHISDDHQSVVDSLLSMDKKYTGLSDHQKELLHFFKQGMTDREIVSAQKGGSTSTIRNHRFKLKEKEKQAKVFLAIMNGLRQEQKESKDDLVEIHKGAKMVDERYAVTVEERDKVLKTYFKEGLNGPLASFPSKEKRKIIVLQHLLQRFDPAKIYSEKSVNEILKSIYSDFATLRRYFIEYGFMERSLDCSEYWVKK
ncbi:DUF2087 domain-containing protein [Salipaludibacillus aurantiacus]|uniref:DUF2087 domain-containing protein n=1 Tax=Salipaludibacillus aurantiacus TaxID=1601833 RepID=A0A1H9VA27_9BACI|nr:DUF2087 domain-containing protein [Salipaludibacillus aurantiacus]SES18680.1 hypothetical protein SAMN05518684_11037 [Salipaludibacillus aurantiacus]